jgi:hypothetical protein
MLAGAARTGLRSGAQQALSQPEGQALLADAGRPVQEQGAGQRVATDGVVESRAKSGMAVERE